MSTVFNRPEEQESALIMSAINRYFGDIPQSPGPAGSDSSLLEALNAYFKDRTEA
jgi:hypothetical protein